jgi:hypothetical protein
MDETGQRPLDALALGGQQFASPLRIHQATLAQHRWR